MMTTHITSREQLRDILGLGVMLQHHLRYNHYPPHPDCMVPVAERAVRIAREAQDLPEMWDQEIELPPNVEMKDGRKTMTVSEAFETFRLEDFIDEGYQ